MYLLQNKTGNNFLLNNKILFVTRKTSHAKEEASLRNLVREELFPEDDGGNLSQNCSQQELIFKVIAKYLTDTETENVT